MIQLEDQFLHKIQEEVLALLVKDNHKDFPQEEDLEILMTLD
jgi:hypothetical protein